MELWKFGVVLAAIAILILSTLYIQKLRNKELDSKTYVYPKNGHQYLPLFRCRMKCPMSGQWSDALIYQDRDTGHLYVRDKKDFFEKFVKLTEWNNGNNSKQGVSEAD